MWIISGIHQGSDIKIQFQQKCRSAVVKQPLSVSRLNAWFYCFDKFLFKFPHRGSETNIQKLRHLNVLRAPPWMLNQVAPGSRDHHQVVHRLTMLIEHLQRKHTCSLCSSNTICESLIRFHSGSKRSTGTGRNWIYSIYSSRVLRRTFDGFKCFDSL